MSASDTEPAVPDTRLVPAAAAAWLGMWLASGGELWLQGVLAVLAVVAGVGAARRRSLQWAAVALVLAGCLVAGGMRAWQVNHGPLAALSESRATVSVEVEITGEPRMTSSFGQPVTYVPCEVLAVAGRGQAWILRQPAVIRGGAGWSTLVVGSRVGLQGRLAEAEPGRAEAAVVRANGDPHVLAQPPPWLGAVERVRDGLRRAMADTTAERAALVPALVVGDTSAMTDAMQADFRATGLTHLTAVSGANLTLVMVFLSAIAGRLGARGRVLLTVNLVGVLCFVLLCRSEPSVLRAAAMGLVGLAAIGRTPASGAGVRHLSVAVLVLCWLDPWLSRSWGFTLSVVACAGILAWGRRWTESLARWVPLWLAEAIAVPLAAQVATQPVVTAISGQVSLAGLPANLLAGPMVGPATVLGLVAALVSVVHPLPAAVAGWAAGWVAEGILQVAHSFAVLPGASLSWPATPVWVVAIALACVAVALLAGRWLYSPVAVMVALGVVMLGVVRPPVPVGWPSDWLIVACDVGQGDAVLVRAGPRSAILLDTGPDGGALVACLDRAGVDHVPLLVLTHFHADHTGGLARLLGSRRVDVVMVSPLASPSSAAQWVRDSAGRAGADVHVAQPGEVLTVGSAQWTTLAAGTPSGIDTGTDGESSVENDSSVVGRVAVGGLSMLATGDIEIGAQRAILAAGAERLRVDVLKVPHHGSGRQDPAFVAATGARYALVSCGLGNAYGHPAAKTLRLVEGLGMQVFRTDRQGSVSIGQQAGRDVVTVSR